MVVGIGWGFVDVGTDFRYRFFTDYAEYFILTLLVGILLSAVGIILWARRFENGKRRRLAGGLFIGGLTAFPFAVRDVHGPSAFLFLLGSQPG